MPRPIKEGNPDPDWATRLPLEWTTARVDAPDAFFEVARVHFAGLTVTVKNRDFEILATYQLDERPQFDGPSLVGMSDGFPLIVTRDHDCGCGDRTKKVTKDAARTD